MADWLAKPWIEKAICSFYDKDTPQPKFARAQIIQFNKVPSENNASAEALLSDKWMYAKAIFTPQAIEEFEKSPLNMCEFSMCDIKGGLIFLKDYRVVPQVNYAKGVWEHLLIVNKFKFQGSEKSSQFGSELINSAAHSPFQVRIKKHFQLKQLVQLLQRDKNKRKLTLDDNKAFDIKAITDSFVERHQFMFIPDDQRKLLDEIPEWKNDFCPPSTMDQSNSLNTSLPSNQQVQNDVSMSPGFRNFALEQHSEQSLSGVSSIAKDSVSLGNESKMNGKEENNKRLSKMDIDIDERQSLHEGYLVSKQGPVSMVPGQLEEDTASELTVQPFLSGTPLDILENFEHQSDHFACPSRTRKRDSVGNIVEEDEDVEDWSKATNKDKQVRRSSIELALAKQKKIRDDWLGRCSEAEASFHDSSLSVEHLDNKEIENHEESGSGTQKEDSFPRGISIANEVEFSRLWLEFSHSQYPEGRELDNTGDKCMEDITAGDQVEIVFEDAADDNKKRTVKKVVSISKEACHLSVKKDGNQGTKSDRNNKLEDETSVKLSTESVESQELDKNPSEGFSRGSRVESESGNSRYFPGIVNDGHAECSVKGIQDVGIPDYRNWPPSKDGCVVPRSDEMKGISARCGDENTFNSQYAVTGDESSSSKENSAIQQNDSIIGTDGDGGGDETFNSQIVLEDETRGADTQNRTNQGLDQENVKDTTMEYEESCYVAAEAVQRQRRTEEKEKWRRRRTHIESTNVQMFDATSSEPAEAFAGKKGQELNKKSCTETSDSNLGELSTTGAVDKEGFCTAEGVIPNSISDGSSSLEQKSDESFSILKNNSISDLTCDVFKPAFTSTARSISPSAELTRSLKAQDTQNHHGEAENLTATKKHVTFGKSIVYVNKHDFEGSLEPTSSQVVVYPYNNDLSDDDSMVPCTQQEDDSQLMTFEDPLQILRTLSSSATKVFQEYPKSKTFGCQASDRAGHNDSIDHNGDAAGVRFVHSGDVPKCSSSDYNDDEVHCLVGNVLQSADNSRVQRTTKNDAMQRRGNDEHAPCLASCDSDALLEQSLDDAQRLSDGDASNNNDDNSQASSIIGEDKEIILCSDESEEFVRSPRTVAKDSILQCIKQSSNTVYSDLVMGSDDSPGNIISSSPKTAAKQNILRCIHQQANNDSRDDVTRTRSQSKQTSASPSKGRETKNTGLKSRESLQFTLTDSELCKALNSSAEKKNASLLGSKRINNSKKGKSLHQEQRATSSTPVTETGPCSIPISTFCRTKCNDSCKKQPQEDELGRDVKVMSLPEHKGEDVECLMYVPGRGLETSAVRVTLDSIPPTKVPDRNVESNKEANDSRYTKFVSRRQPRGRLSREDKSTEREKDKNWAVPKRRELPQDCTTVAMAIHTNITPPTDLDKGNTIPDLDNKGAHDGNKAVAMETHVLLSRTSRDASTLVEREGRLKRKRSEEEENRAAKKLTIAAPSSASVQVSTRSLSTTKNKNNNEREFTDDSCLHVLYSQQDPLVLEFSPNEYSDDDSSQESKIKDLLSSPILLPSPPRETQTEFTDDSCLHVLYSQQDPLVLEFSPNEYSDDDSSQESKIKDLLSSPILLPSPPRETQTIPQSTNTEMSNLRFKKFEKVMEESNMSEEQETSSPKFVSLPSYQVPITNNTYLRLANEKKNTTPHINTTQGKTKPFILSDSEEDENESNFCWFTTR